MQDLSDRDRALADLADIMLADLERLQAVIDAQIAATRVSLTAFRDVAGAR